METLCHPSFEVETVEEEEHSTAAEDEPKLGDFKQQQFDKEVVLEYKTILFLQMNRAEKHQRSLKKIPHKCWP